MPRRASNRSQSALFDDYAPLDGTFDEFFVRAKVDRETIYARTTSFSYFFPQLAYLGRGLL